MEVLKAPKNIEPPLPISNNEAYPKGSKLPTFDIYEGCPSVEVDQANLDIATFLVWKRAMGVKIVIHFQAVHVATGDYTTFVVSNDDDVYSFGCSESSSLGHNTADFDA
ncbi:hypothetical protein L1987_11000 [Smallanthus sonchifolius]|uniref:Uncharacterized protein n=1 Tax=Smallanthus sonchifolius TaxID=185202 RepID=A0ACB9JBU2_9ASTR|nr:hypothetical protein L1987_11000 [Smallanthus sonchifolius]